MVTVMTAISYDRRCRWTDFAQVGGGFPGENPRLPGALSPASLNSCWVGWTVKLTRWNLEPEWPFGTTGLVTVVVRLPFGAGLVGPDLLLPSHWRWQSGWVGTVFAVLLPVPPLNKCSKRPFPLLP